MSRGICSNTLIRSVWKTLFLLIKQKPHTIFMPPTLKKLRDKLVWACPSVCAWCVMLCIRSKTVRDRILKFYVKNKRTHIFFLLFHRTCCRVTGYRHFSDFPIVSLWNLVNKISREPLDLGSRYLAHRLCP